MTKSIKLLTLCLVVTGVLLSSCSSKFGSRKEARLAATDYEEGGRSVLVIDKPTDEDYEMEQRRALRELEAKCANQRALLLPHHYQSTITNYPQRERWNYHLEAKEFVTSFCSPPKVSVDRDLMTERRNLYTRGCEEETSTNQFVCEERRTGKKQMTQDEWSELKTHYTYFRY